jgi:prolyl-tRNA synthetase
MYEDVCGEQQYAQQTCYGISERCIAALISLHGDEKGLVLPPAVAPVQVVVVPITIGKRKDEVVVAAREIESLLSAAGVRVKTDLRDLRPGAKYYYWEMRGVPLRLEVGPRDLDAGQVTAVTRLGEKAALPRTSLLEGVTDTLIRFTSSLMQKAEDHVRSRIRIVPGMDELSAAVEDGAAIITWCGERECADAIEAAVNASVLGTEVRADFIQPGTCISCGKEGKGALVGRAY